MFCAKLCAHLLVLLIERPNNLNKCLVSKEHRSLPYPAEVLFIGCSEYSGCMNVKYAYEIESRLLITCSPWPN